MRKTLEDQAVAGLETIGKAGLRVVGAVGRVLSAPLRLPGLGHRQTMKAQRRVGVSPGIEGVADIDTPPSPGEIKCQCIDYCEDRVEARDVDDLIAFLKGPRPDWVTVRWINVDGLHPYIVNKVREAFNFHTLAAEDVLHTPQRPKVEAYDDHLFIVFNMLMMSDAHFRSEQISVFYYANTLITFQETHGDVWDAIRRRIDKPGSRHRKSQAGYLLYSLLDAIVDQCFPILEQYGDILEDVETVIAERPTPRTLHQLHAIKRELVVLRRLIWPMRELLDRLHRDEEEMLSDHAETYMRDVYDHAIQLVDIVETYREMAAGMTDLYLSSVSNRMNEVMKVLTMIGSLFIPITFLAGVYGMNFKHMPEIDQWWAYPTFWGLCAAITIGMFVFFWRRGWIGRR